MVDQQELVMKEIIIFSIRKVILSFLIEKGEKIEIII